MAMNQNQVNGASPEKGGAIPALNLAGAGVAAAGAAGVAAGVAGPIDPVN